jgi:hypothetical protein
MNIILERWHVKLTNWSYWKLGSGGSGGVSSAYDGHWDDGAPRPPVPLVGDALDTDDLVQKLSEEHREAITVCYLWTVPETLGERAKLIGIHRDTLAERLKQAKFRLDDLDCARRRAMVRIAA